MRNVLLLAFLLTLIALPASAQSERRTESRRDTATERRDSTPRGRAKRVPVTDQHRATAFKDARARELLLGARRARMTHDSALRGYDATTYQRISAGLAFKAVGRERLIFRHENSTRVRWQHGVGAIVDVTGARTVIPVVSGITDAQDDIDRDVNSEVGGDMASIPYRPGQETLWIGSGRARAEVDETELVHPLAEGAEAYYTYATGDSMTYRLPQGTQVVLREMRVIPREPKWNLIVGSFWFDVGSHQLVRAAYRLSVPIDIWAIAKEDDPSAQDDIPAWVLPLITPMRGTVSVITVEYGLHEGRFWLPRLQAIEGEAQVSFMRAPFRVEERFQYASVNGADSTLPMPPVPPDVLHLQRLDSLASAGDTIARAEAKAIRDARAAAREAARLARRDTLRMLDSLARGGDEAARARAKEMRRPRISQCDTAATSRGSRREDGLRVIVNTPCDEEALARSPTLPASIYDAGETVFDSPDMDQLRGLIDMGLQAEWGPQRPQLRYGVGDGMLRYNRVEGLSPALGAVQALGAGYTADAQVRIGTADWQPNAELGLSRSDGRRTIRVGAFRRLAVANDWGTPLGFGSSLSSLLFARDEGFYYRSWGAELTATGMGNPNLVWRAFAERHTDADVETQLSVPHLLNDVRFLPNIDATDATLVGAEARILGSYGSDPRGFRVFTQLRGESGAGSLTYTRALADITLSRALLRSVDGSLTLSGGGATLGTPVQRQFQLGGSQTIRGQRAGTMMGETFWMTRLELGSSFVAARPVVFADIGWAGPADMWKHPGRPASGVGVGASFMDGLIRFDVARGIFPRKGFRSDMYIEARF